MSSVASPWTSGNINGGTYSEVAVRAAFPLEGFEDQDHFLNAMDFLLSQEKCSSAWDMSSQGRPPSRAQVWTEVPLSRGLFTQALHCFLLLSPFAGPNKYAQDTSVRMKRKVVMSSQCGLTDLNKITQKLETQQESLRKPTHNML